MSDPAEFREPDAPLDPVLLRAFAAAAPPPPDAAFVARLCARLQREQRRAAVWRILGIGSVAALGAWLLAPLAGTLSVLASTELARGLVDFDQLALTPVGSLLFVPLLVAGWRLRRR